MRNILPLTFLLAYTMIARGQVGPTQEAYVQLSPEDTARLKEAGEVYYSNFGAKGDGQTDDLDAIADAHEFANQHGLIVKADDGATYYIGGKDRTVDIQTDTDFGTASFTIDDTEVENRRASVFSVSASSQSLQLSTVSSLERSQEKIDVSLPSPSIITVVNDSVKHYIREGLNQDGGYSQIDLFVVDQEGNVDTNTPIIWDFDQITTMTALPIDQEENTLVITGGRFTTLANREASEYNYYSRNFKITRSHVIIDGMEHYITGEGEQGAPYAGFININSCAYITVKNTILTGHKTYYTIGSAGKPVPMGSYDISLGRALNVSFVNCRQSNDVNDRQYWGIMNSNHCKNLLLDDCVFSRFDAHRGVTDATIRNSTLGHMGVNAIGSGTLTLENTTVRAKHLINLRPDYGSTWRGEFVIRDCTFAPDTSRTNRVDLIGGRYSSKHDFGYPCYLPERITIENLQVEDAHYPEDYPGPAIIANFNPQLTDESYQEDFPYIRTGEVILSNVTIASSKEMRLSDNLFMFKDVTVTERPPDREGTITVRAEGSTGEEQIILRADGVAQGEAITLSTIMTDYPISLNAPYSDLEVAFTNDGTNSAGADKNVRIDYLIVGADTVQAEDQLVNTGNWSAQGGCGSGGASEWLYCQGYIAFDKTAELTTVAHRNATARRITSEEAQVYPNPSRGRVIVEGPRHYELQVYDLEGRKVAQFPELSGRSSVDVADLLPGVYVVQLTDGDTGQTYQRRLMVE